VNQFLESRELIRRLKKGFPVRLEDDEVRLPRFTETVEVDGEEYGVSGSMQLIVAQSRTATWCIWAANRKAKVGAKDGKRFMKVLEAVAERYPQRPVRGWLLTPAVIDDAVRSQLAEAGHYAHRVPL
jgi:hypothetical protein